MPAELVDRARHGDHEAFTRLVNLGGDRCYGVAYRILRDRDRAQDAVQQAFVQVWQELPRLRDPERYDVWLYRIVVNAAYAEARRQRRWSGHIRELTDDGPSALDPMLQSIDQRDALDEAFRSLSVEHRAVVVLHHQVGLPLETVAEIVEAPVGTVKSRLYYATRAMRRTLTAEPAPISHDPRPA